MGDKTQRVWGGSTVKGKGRAVLGIGIPARHHQKPVLRPTHFSVRDPYS